MILTIFIFIVYITVFCNCVCEWEEWGPWDNCRFSKQKRSRSGSSDQRCDNFRQTQNQEQPCIEDTGHLAYVAQLATVCSSLDGAMIGSSCYFLNYVDMTWNDHWDYCTAKAKEMSTSIDFSGQLAQPISSDVASVIMNYLEAKLDFTDMISVYIGGKYFKDDTDPQPKDASNYYWMRSKNETFQDSMIRYNNNILGALDVSDADVSPLCLQIRVKTWMDVLWIKASQCTQTFKGLCQMDVKSVTYRLLHSNVRLGRKGSGPQLYLDKNGITNEVWDCGMYCSNTEGCVSFTYNPSANSCKWYGFKTSDTTLDERWEWKTTNLNQNYYERLF